MTFDEFYAGVCERNRLNPNTSVNLSIKDYCREAFEAGASSRDEFPASIETQTHQENEDSITFAAVGWRAIGALVGSNAQTLAVRNSYGTLPVTPFKLPNGKVAMTREQIETLSRAKI